MFPLRKIQEKHTEEDMMARPPPLSCNIYIQIFLPGHSTGRFFIFSDTFMPFIHSDLFFKKFSWGRQLQTHCSNGIFSKIGGWVSDYVMASSVLKQSALGGAHRELILRYLYTCRGILD